MGRSVEDVDAVGYPRYGMIFPDARSGSGVSILITRRGTRRHGRVGSLEKMCSFFSSFFQEQVSLDYRRAQANSSLLRYHQNDNASNQPTGSLPVC